MTMDAKSGLFLFLSMTFYLFKKMDRSQIFLQHKCRLLYTSEIIVNVVEIKFIESNLWELI